MNMKRYQLLKKNDLYIQTDDDNISITGIEQINTILDKYTEGDLKFGDTKNKKRNQEKKISYQEKSQIVEYAIELKEDGLVNKISIQLRVIQTIGKRMNL
ncbi:unnamed protein product (macronuclear) [Paramecium tetraurelia]|uniref:Uncharacterized protein n=1 Tax=Paramecium tetraurelia TaxID=5888 RepID=A0D7C3_PARTE|nr:uncharacterized protein GSPATT00001982001 [Paramecium tetraurelia]CAK78940.1 unnamed protein product [Paramecium tetraurelia]|eukprot:XP_001446337.1 hypothetical protein (macronuclear) [Paramecium tetraurelia strain d4-2]